MGSVDEKLRRGYALAARADGDGDVLGVALLALHGALEDHLDEALAQHAGMSPEDRQALDEPGYGWVTRVNLALRYSMITREQRQAILDANRQRQEFAHGSPFAGGQEQLEDYARLVVELCGGRPTAARPVRPAARAASGSAAARPAARAARSTEGTTVVSASSRWDDRARQRGARRGDLLPDSLLVRAAIAAVAVLLLAFAGWRLLSGVSDPSEASVNQGGALAPAITPAPTLPPVTPTPEVREARIVGLGGATGYMHEPAGFNTPTQPRPLPEGTVVELMDDPPTEADGATWVRISFGGYEGWVPQNNVEAVVPGAAPTPTAATAGP